MIAPVSHLGLFPLITCVWSVTEFCQLPFPMSLESILSSTATLLGQSSSHQPWLSTTDFIEHQLWLAMPFKV